MPKYSRPTSYSGRKGSQEKTGDIRFANSTESAEGIVTDLAISPKTMSESVASLIPDASTTVKGKIEIATDSESIAGIDNDKAIVPTSLKAKLGLQSNNSLAYGQGTTNALAYLNALVDGQLPIGSTGNPPTPGFITSTGGSINVTNSPGNINVESIADVVGPGSATDNALARFDLTTGKLLQNSTVLVSDAGEMTNSSQPAFFGKLFSDTGGVTGAGTVYNVGSVVGFTEIYDQNSDFAAGTGIFTAPVTGKYYFDGLTSFGSLTAAMTFGSVRLSTSNNIVYGMIHNIAAVRTGFSTASLTLSTSTDMDAGDISVLQVQIAFGAGDTANLLNGGALTIQTAYSGFLIC